MYSAIIIGSGFSGICMGIELRKKGINDFLILEKEMDLGGTWRDNTYPGAECDIPSALYSYSFEPNPNWNFKWSHQEQILFYLRHCVSKYEISDHIRYGAKVVGASFLTEQKAWKVFMQDGSTYRSKALISAIGQLHYPRMPNLDGLNSFKGASWHSARWNHEISLAGKRVGVIGNAASAVQFIPVIAEEVSDLYIFQRSANWMVPKPDRAYHPWEKKIRSLFPFILRVERFRLWLTGGVLYYLMGKNAFFKKIAQNRAIRYVRKVVKDRQLQDKLIPDYPIGAKRVLFSDNYYTSLTRPNVHLVTVPIKKIYSEGILSEGNDRIELDILIYATGFQTNPFLQYLNICGLNGISIHDFWQKEQKAYLGISVSGFPNFFMMYGPNTNLGHNSIVIMSECQARYIGECLAVMKKKGWHYLDIKEAELDKYYNKIQQRLQNSAWTLIKDSWYKAGDKIPNNWPGRTWEYMRKTRHVNFSAYNCR